MVIAVVLDWMISFPKLRERLAALALLAAVVAGVNAGSFAAAHSGAFRKAQPGDEIPKTHWIMMGLAGNGGYNNEDYVLTFSAPDGESAQGAYPGRDRRAPEGDGARGSGAARTG